MHVMRKVYIFVKSIYMNRSATRKLIDIKPSVINALKIKARRKGVSLKRYIEDLLEEDSNKDILHVPEGVSNAKVIALIGVAKPSVDVDMIDDERLQYILSK